MSADRQGLRERLDRPGTLIMGVLNVTPDSFSDGGQYNSTAAALDRAKRMVVAGADIVDIGGESTRPGADAVSLEQERQRILPLLETLVSGLGVPVSVDTSKPELMREAVAAGAAMINDVRALRAPGALEAVAAGDALVCLMHMQGEPRSMQADPRYGDVVAEVGDFLVERLAACVQAGIDPERVILDPGFGFGKTLAHNLALLAGLDVLVRRGGRPLLAGLSRKRMIGTLLGDAPVDERLHGSVAAAVIAAMSGARIVRVHDVQATREALRVADAVLDEASGREGRS